MDDFKALRKNSFDLMETQETLRRFEKRLRGLKPGLKAQLRMITNPRPGHKVYFEVEGSSRKAGVLILIYPWKNRHYLVLTRRTSQLDHHQAQISLPGGGQEEGESLIQTAMREACEELDIHPGNLRVMGELTPLYIPPSNYCIYPVVATAERRPDFRPSPEEVDEVIEIPLEHLLDRNNITKEMWNIQGVEVEVPFYFYRGYKIWGATAMVLAELLELWKHAQD